MIPVSVWASIPGPSELDRCLDRLLALRHPSGAIPDVPGGTVVNADSNFLYLLEGVSAQVPGGRKAELRALVVQGLRWLAAHQWGEGDPLPGAFPDALPLEGPGQPLGAPPVAAVGATSARFVALVSTLDPPPADLREAARRAWEGLLKWNLGTDGAIWNCWEQRPDGTWSRRPVRYAADQADYRVGRAGAARLGFRTDPRDPFAPFFGKALAQDGAGRSLALDPDAELGALAVLAFDGPPGWRTQALRRLEAGFRERRDLLSMAALAANGHRECEARLRRHLTLHPLALDHEFGGEIHMNVTGFVLRSLRHPHAR